MANNELNRDKTGVDEGLDFAPNTNSDHRPVGSWQSRYPKEAQKQLAIETIYLVVIFVTIPISLASIEFSTTIPFLQLTAHQFNTFQKYSFSFFGGLLGGTLFDMKWLYHSVAHGIWNQDRLLWRILTPLISAGLAFAFFILLKSDIFKILDATSIDKAPSIIGVSFLVGYFSDSALAKMYEIATTLFGVHSKSKEKSK